MAHLPSGRRRMYALLITFAAEPEACKMLLTTTDSCCGQQLVTQMQHGATWPTCTFRLIRRRGLAAPPDRGVRNQCLTTTLELRIVAIPLLLVIAALNTRLDSGLGEVGGVFGNSRGASHI